MPRSNKIYNILFLSISRNFTYLFLSQLSSTKAQNGGPGSPNTTQPHIMFIMVDDMGWNDIGYHGSEILTPNLDKLADSGVKLENYYTAPVCGPTRAQLLSGKYFIA